MAKMALGDPRAIKGIVVPLKKIYTFFFLMSRNLSKAGPFGPIKGIVVPLKKIYTFKNKYKTK
jgi:hypothetical protein